MKFFGKIKRRMIFKIVLHRIGFVVLALWFAISGVFTILNPFVFQEMRLPLLVRPLDALIGNVFPDSLSGEAAAITIVLLGIAVLIVGLIVAGSIIYNGVQRIRSLNEFADIMNQVKMIGDVDEIGRTLESLPQNGKVINGDLRMNEDILYFSDGASAKIVSGKNVLSADGVIRKGRYYVDVSTSLQSVGVLQIQTTQENVKGLFYDIATTLGL